MVRSQGPGRTLLLFHQLGLTIQMQMRKKTVSPELPLQVTQCPQPVGGYLSSRAWQPFTAYVGMTRGSSGVSPPCLSAFSRWNRAECSHFADGETKVGVTCQI